MILTVRDCEKIALSANVVIQMFQKKDQSEDAYMIFQEKLNPVEFECFYEDTSEEVSNAAVVIDAGQMEGLIY